MLPHRDLCKEILQVQHCFQGLFPVVSPRAPQVAVGGQGAEGMGPSKKVAKRNAAEKMLELLGFKVPQPQPPKPALKTEEKVAHLRARHTHNHCTTGLCEYMFYWCILIINKDFIVKRS